MTRYFLCKDCGSRWRESGIHQLFAAEGPYPAEFGRITRGIAGQPKPQQRILYINGVAQPPMDLRYYNCDLCMAEIRPGDPCVAQTVWKQGDEMPPNWEAKYMVT